MVDLLDHMVSKANSVGHIEGFAISKEGPIVLFIQFVDDSLFLLKDEVAHLLLHCPFVWEMWC